MARSGFRWEDGSLFRSAPGLAERIDGMVSTVVEYYSTRATSHMRSNAPWRDQTGNARNGLRATTNHVPFRRHSIILSHGVPYGIWLEVRWSGRYAIIDPTMRAIGPQVLDMIGRRWGPTISRRTP
jgi:hypothetical protein